MSYASDGKCHNAQPGTYGHECGKPSTWIGVRKDRMFKMGFCDHCKENGYEARKYDLWIKSVDHYAHPDFDMNT